jgi:hypothetical protein
MPLAAAKFPPREVTNKRRGLLHDLVPKAVRVAVLVNPGNASSAKPRCGTCVKRPPTMGLQIEILNAPTIGYVPRRDGPARGAPAIVGAGMVGDRADVIFAAPEEISRFVRGEC